VQEHRQSASPQVANLFALAAGFAPPYENRVLSTVNDHVVRMSVMTEPFRWHLHPNSDEVFLCLEGRLRVDLDGREVVLEPGDLMTVPAGVAHCTAPADGRSVNLTIERADLQTVWLEGPRPKP
jgi:mannose-6-phosphate isomerase-like protein (cupin superfamily)